MTYEVLGYKSQEDYDAVKFELIDDGIRHKRDALRLARGTLVDYPLVKVQNHDRSFIELLERN
jgi:hypothetical protein